MINIAEPQFGDEELALVRECLDSRWVTQGPFVARFEQLFAARHQTTHALATTSGSAALHLAGLALGLGPGDEVIVPAFSWITTAHTAEYAGARAVFADIDLQTFNVDPALIRQAITPRTRAIVAVHLFGLPADMAAILAIAQEHGLAVIEDAACAVGAFYENRPVGSMGDLGCFSFHPRKVITTGEGGMLTTQRDDLAVRIKSLRNHGATGPPAGADPSRPHVMATFDELGFNLRLSDIQAAIGVAQMARLDGLIGARRTCAERYHAQLEPMAAAGDLTVPTHAHADGHTFQSYVVRVVEGGTARRNAIMDDLKAHGIQTRPGTHAIHRLGYFRKKYGLRAEQFPNACLAEDTTITLPILPNMSATQQQLIVTQLRHALAKP